MIKYSRHRGKTIRSWTAWITRMRTILFTQLKCVREKTQLCLKHWIVVRQILRFSGRSLQAMCTVIVYETVLVFNTILVADLGCISNGKIMICCSWEDSFNPLTGRMIKWFGVLVVSDAGRKYSLKVYKGNYIQYIFVACFTKKKEQCNDIIGFQIQIRFTLGTHVKRSSWSVEVVIADNWL